MEKKLGVRYKDAPPGEFILIVDWGKPYKLPATLDKKRIIERVPIGIPQQDEFPDETLPVEREIFLDFSANYEPGTQITITTNPMVVAEMPKRECKKCGNPLTWINVCCDDRAAGIKEKWHCSLCKVLIKIKGV